MFGVSEIFFLQVLTNLPDIVTGNFLGPAVKSMWVVILMAVNI